jgi:HAD superfamily hydrolase (TIGR01549 family)
MDRWVVLDVGEVLVDETRVWSTWADQLQVPRLTFMALLGAAIARGSQHGEVFTQFGIHDWRKWATSVEAAYGGFQADDLYPDAIPAIETLRQHGLRIGVVANQPAQRTGELQALGVSAEVMAMSGELGVSKPSPEFFDRVLALTGADPANLAYVGDRIDNDVLPALAAGMRAVWVRRGPWGRIQRLPAGVAPSMVVDSLAELAGRADDLWTGGA